MHVKQKNTSCKSSKNHPIRFPNVFILGAPKCGTSALFEYLCQHPNVYEPRVKESNYFNLEFEDHRQAKSEKEYHQLYSAGPEYLAAVDASVWYFYSEKAVQMIQSFNPDAKFIIMLRSPIQMLTSMHNHHSQVLLSEDEPDFETAWRIQDQRLNGEIPLPKSLVRFPAFHYHYKTLGKLGARVKYILEQVDKTKIKILLFDDFVADTPRIFSEVLEFLELSPISLKNSSQVNPRRAYRYPRLVKTIHYFYSCLYLFRQRLNLRWNTNAWKLVDRFLTRPQPKIRLPMTFQKEMMDEFNADIQLLEQLLGRDLSHWRELPQVPLPESD